MVAKFVKSSHERRWNENILFEIPFQRVSCRLIDNYQQSWFNFSVRWQTTILLVIDFISVTLLTWLNMHLLLVFLIKTNIFKSMKKKNERKEKEEEEKKRGWNVSSTRRRRTWNLFIIVRCRKGWIDRLRDREEFIDNQILLARASESNCLHHYSHHQFVFSSLFYRVLYHYAICITESSWSISFFFNMSIVSEIHYWFILQVSGNDLGNCLSLNEFCRYSLHVVD